MRDRLINGYFGVDHNIVWDVAINKLPELELRAALVMKNENTT